MFNTLYIRQNRKQLLLINGKNQISSVNEELFAEVVIIFEGWKEIDVRRAAISINLDYLNTRSSLSNVNGFSWNLLQLSFLHG